MSAPAKTPPPNDPSPALDLVGLIAEAVFEEFVEGMKKARESQKTRPKAEEAAHTSA
jgi:hypothetical protein